MAYPRLFSFLRVLEYRYVPLILLSILFNYALTIDAAPLVAGGKVLVPLAFVAEQLGWNVSSEKEGEWLRYNLSPSENAGTLKNQP
ncbi:stalk domain-containing protein [Paenibacillus odorifer]|uniref:stalk domain-containing protein n=1 Tax=Paenibacillus sp. FSL R5-0908 TaxID=2921664 RepID=UPI000DAD05AF